MASNENMVEANDTSFADEVLASELPVLVEFSATWCAPCRVLAPVVERLAAELAGQVKVVVMDLDASPRTSARYGVRGAPTLLVFRGGERTAQHLGVTSKERLRALVGV